MKKIILGLAIFFLGVSPVFATSTVYNALPDPLPPNAPSQPFQAQQTFEFGDYIHLGGTDRKLTTVTVAMSDWALYSDYASDVRYSGNSETWTHPITINIYSNHLSGGVPDQLLATKTQNIVIPWRPTADPTCATPTAWKAGDGNCYNGYAFNAVFDLSSLGVVLPNDIIVSLAYNTQTWGAEPIGSNGPYNSLNVLVPPNQLVTVGTDDSNDKVFWDTVTAAWYEDDGTAGVGIFREDTNWTPYGTVAMKIEAIQAPTTPPTNKDQCKNDGWKSFNNPSYKNQGDCVSDVATRYSTFTADDSLYYNCPTVCESIYGSGVISFTWEKETGNVVSGYYNEVVPPTTGTTYYNVVTSGSVVGDTVNLTFNRTNPNNYGPFNFIGTLLGNVLSGTLDGPYYFTATGN